jgi:hypothetical protein
MLMTKKDATLYGRTTLNVTVEGLLALAGEAVVAAENAQTKELRLSLCEKAMKHLRVVVLNLQPPNVPSDDSTSGHVESDPIGRLGSPTRETDPGRCNTERPVGPF